jgi:sRNA-binding regulator protein Hfq
MNRSSERVNIATCLGLVLLILLPIGRAEGASDNEWKLLDLARKKFDPLTEAEMKLFQAVVNGELADYSDKSGKNNDPNMAKDWDQNTRVIMAKCIAWLCTDPEASAMVTHKGIWVKGARINGGLNLEYAEILFPLCFINSAFTGWINLRQAEIRELRLIGTYTGPIYCYGLKVKGDVSLRNGFQANGTVDLVGAKIDGILSCNGGQFINKGAVALAGNGLKIEGSVHLCNGFKAEGEVNLVGAIIDGVLSCQNGQFINKRRIALTTNRASIGSSVYLQNGFKAEGEVNLIRTTIGGHLVCTKGEFINPNGFAINADNMDVKGNVYFREGFKAEGGVELIRASIGGNLICHKGQFINKKGRALNAENLYISGGVYLMNGFHADGEVNLHGATIDKYFVWNDVNSPEEITLDLRFARIGTLYDDAKSWPNQKKLFLHGLVYNEIDDNAPRDAKRRIGWLQLQYDYKAEKDKKQFQPQPYEQLAEVLRKGGQDDDAKKILIAKNKDRARLTKLTWSEICWYRGLGLTIDYGYRPLKALWGMAVFIALGCILFRIGHRNGLITPQDESAYLKRSVSTIEGDADNRELSDLYPSFNFLAYSVDVFVPLIDLHPAKYWLPNANLGSELNIKGFSLHTGGLLRLYLWIHIIMGWVLTTLLVVGLTRLIRT